MTSNEILAGKTAVVTGGASGIGRGIALAFGQHGADVVVADIREEPREGGTPTHERIEDESQNRATYVECDVTEPDTLATAVDEADAYGGLDTFVNNAAIGRLDDYDVDETEFDEFFDTNVKGYFFGARAAAERIGEGCIINVASVEALEGVAQRPVYGATRGAIRQLTWALADRLGPEIRVNSIHPGLVDTALTREDIPIFDEPAFDQFLKAVPLERAGQPADIGGPAVFLASDLAAYVSGAEIVVDGGMTYTW